MDNETKKRAEIAVDTALKLRMMSLLSDDFLRWVSDIEMNPSPENLERIERWNKDMAAHFRAARRAVATARAAIVPEARILRYHFSELN